MTGHPRKVLLIGKRDRLTEALVRSFELQAFTVVHYDIGDSARTKCENAPRALDDAAMLSALLNMISPLDAVINCFSYQIPSDVLSLSRGTGAFSQVVADLSRVSHTILPHLRPAGSGRIINLAQNISNPRGKRLSETAAAAIRVTRHVNRGILGKRGVCTSIIARGAGFDLDLAILASRAVMAVIDPSTEAIIDEFGMAVEPLYADHELPIGIKSFSNFIGG